MEEMFGKLQKEGKNTVDNIVKWMKDSKIVDSTKASEDKVREMFADVANKSNVEYKKFEEAVKKLAEEQKETSKDLFGKMMAEGTKLMNATAEAGKAAVMAFKDSMNK